MAEPDPQRCAPTDIKLHRQTQALELIYADGTSYRLSAEYLRLFSPSAEVRGHGYSGPPRVPRQPEVRITAIKPVGHYAIQLAFDDGHDTGIYAWPYLYDLAVNADAHWRSYLAQDSQR